MRRKVIKTHYVEASSGGKFREGIRLDMECGHFVDRVYSNRRDYREANCPWCNLEQRDGVKYVWHRRVLPIDLSDNAPDFVPDPTQPLL